MYVPVVIVIKYKNTNIFQVLGTNIGTVLVYKLKKESYCSEKAEFEQELHAFMNYITLL